MRYQLDLSKITVKDYRELCDAEDQTGYAVSLMTKSVKVIDDQKSTAFFVTKEQIDQAPVGLIGSFISAVAKEANRGTTDFFV